jgi:pyridoxal biosynthesis lyase PdxS
MSSQIWGRGALGRGNIKETSKKSKKIQRNMKNIEETDGEETLDRGHASQAARRSIMMCQTHLQGAEGNDVRSIWGDRSFWSFQKSKS